MDRSPNALPAPALEVRAPPAAIPEPATSPLHRWKLWLPLAAMTVLALLLRLHYAAIYPPHIDEEWHIFAATVQPLGQYLVELRDLAHPPLSALLLRLVMVFGDTGAHLTARLIALVPGLLTIPVCYFCCRRLGLGKALALLGSLLVALSPAHATVSVLTRGYSMAALFSLLAYAPFLALLRATSDEQRRSYLRSTLTWSALAMWTEYSAWFVAAAAFCTLVVYRRVRVILVDRRAVYYFAASILVMFGYLAWTVGVSFYGHFRPFLPNDSPLWRFALLGCERNLKLFTSIPLSAAATVVVVVLGAALLWPLLKTDGQRRGHGVQATAPLILAQLVGLAFILAAIGLYPFGGELRHQFFMFPFALFCLLLAVDRVRERVPVAGRRVFMVAIYAAAVGWASWAWNQPIPEVIAPTPAQQADMQTLLSAVDTDPIYTGPHNIYSMSGALPGARWHCEPGCADECQVCEVTRADDKKYTVIRDPDVFIVPQVPDEKFVARLRTVMTALGTEKIWVLSLMTFGNPVDLARTLAAYRSQGFTASHLAGMSYGEAWQVARRPSTRQAND